MKEYDLLRIKEGDSFIFPDSYTTSDYRIVKHNYKCTVIFVVFDDGLFQGCLIKRWLKTRKRYDYEFFDYYKILIRCELENAEKTN